jgi:hypothetical protein
MEYEQNDYAFPFWNVCIPDPGQSHYTLVQQLTISTEPFSLREKARLIFRATRTHARNLAKFAAIYKATCLLLKWYGTTPGKEGRRSKLSPCSRDRDAYLIPSGRKKKS